MIHITLLQKPTLDEKMVMRRGTSAVDWWLGISKRFSCFSKSRSAPLSATSYPDDQAQQETIEHSQEKKNSSICQNSSGWARASGERRASQTRDTGIAYRLFSVTQITLRIQIATSAGRAILRSISSFYSSLRSSLLL